MRGRSGTVEGRSEGPVHARCEVIARRREGSYWLLSVAAKEIAERAHPGQFVEIAVEAQETLLRRPFSIARVTRQGRGPARWTSCSTPTGREPRG